MYRCAVGHLQRIYGNELLFLSLFPRRRLKFSSETRLKRWLGFSVLSCRDGDAPADPDEGPAKPNGAYRQQR